MQQKCEWQHSMEWRTVAASRLRDRFRGQEATIALSVSICASVSILCLCVCTHPKFCRCEILPL